MDIERRYFSLTRCGKKAASWMRSNGESSSFRNATVREDRLIFHSKEAVKERKIPKEMINVRFLVFDLIFKLDKGRKSSISEGTHYKSIGCEGEATYLCWHVFIEIF